MRGKRSGHITILAVVLLAAGCGRQQGPMPLLGTPQVLENPAGTGSAQPRLWADADGGFLLAWQTRGASRTTRFAFASRQGGEWSPVRTISEGNDFFVNWADVPSIHRLADGTLAAHWLQMSGPGTYAYDVKLRLSGDEGRTWSETITPHSDGTQTEHGFASLFDDPDGGLGLVWLDGREMASSDGHDESGPQAGAMTLRYGRIATDGRILSEQLLDDRVCECCPTAAVRTRRGVVVAYRDRSSDEIRDISVVRYEEGRWSQPRPVHRDGWRIAGCPVNGPALAADGDHVALAWFTEQGDDSRALVAFSSDAGDTWTGPVRVDEDLTLGRVGVALLADGTAVVSYMAFSGDEVGLRLRTIRADSTRGTPLHVGAISGSRASGMPRLAHLAADGSLVVAWTETGRSPRVRTAIIPVGAPERGGVGRTP